MIKNSWLTLFIFWTAGTLSGISPVFAQSEMDTLLFEKKAETSPNKTNAEKIKNETRSKPVGRTLSDTLSEEGKTDSVQNTAANEVAPEENESWLKSLISKGTSELFKTDNQKVREAEKARIERVLQNRKSNAANFDISGIKLRMSPNEAETIMNQQGYKKILERMEVPNFIKWRSEELCRQHGVIGFERLNACALTVARENGYQFVEYQVYNRYITKESIEIYYTSTFTDNLAHYIFYKSDVPFSDSKASKNVYLNNIKVFDFWRRIDLKYGKPDNETEVKWGLGGKKPYMKAGTGRLELSDPLLKDLDTARMLNEDTRFANTQYYTF